MKHSADTVKMIDRLVFLCDREGRISQKLIALRGELKS